MSKPVFPVIITTVENQTATVNAVFDSGSYPTIIRQDKLPPGQINNYLIPTIYRGAVQGSKLEVIGVTRLIVEYNNHQFYVWAEVSPQLSSDMLIGASSMQQWDISITNKNGKTDIHIAHDRRDPELNIIEELNSLTNPNLL